MIEICVEEYGERPGGGLRGVFFRGDIIVFLWVWCCLVSTRVMEGFFYN